MLIRVPRLCLCLPRGADAHEDRGNATDPAEHNAESLDPFAYRHNSIVVDARYLLRPEVIDSGRSGPAHHCPNKLTALATTRVRIAIEMLACSAIATFAQMRIGITSVGLNAVALVNPR